MNLKDILNKQDLQELKELIQIRRHIHQYPQIGLQEIKTSQFVRNYLKKIQGVQILQHKEQIKTAVIARINVQNPCQTYLFRCQLDALPWKENSGQQFSSKNQYHHACGHDAHTAIMMVACKKIASLKNKLKRNIIFCFQPGEEGKAGAKKVVKAYQNQIKQVNYAFALHSANHYTAGYVLLSPGIISANTTRFKIAIKGKDCHVMTPQSGIDANFIGCGLVSQLYSLKQLKISPSQKGTLCVIKVAGGQSGAKISNKFQIEGTLRMMSVKNLQKMQKQIQNLAQNYCKAFGATSKTQFSPSPYRSVVNDIQATQIVKKLLEQKFDKQYIKQHESSFNGEDFCQFSQRIPSCYFILGAGVQGSINQDRQSQYPLHSNTHKLDEKFMFLGLQIWTKLALS